MILLTPELRERLLANGRERGTDHIPVAKFFNPLGEGIWLAAELDKDGDTLFGLADLGEPELGSFGLAEMSVVQLPLGLGIERDVLFEGFFSDFGLGRGRTPNRQHPGGRARAPCRPPRSAGGWRE